MKSKTVPYTPRMLFRGEEARGKILFLCRGSNLNRPVVQSGVRRYAD
jgi:hypothetical protein